MNDDRRSEAVASRRRFVQRAVAGAIVGMVRPLPHWVIVSNEEPSRAYRTPDGAIEEMLAGNRRFAGNRLNSIEQDLTILKEHTVDKQEPFAAVLACADSRVPVELIFDQSIGHLFVTRVAGNIATPEIIASLEYAVAVLGIRAVLVLGHTNCGAVKAALKTETVPGQISALYPHLRQAVERSGGQIDQAIRANTQVQAELLRSSSTVIMEAVRKGTLKVAAGVYDLGSGVVTVS